MEMTQKCSEIRKSIDKMAGRYSAPDIFRDIIDLAVMLIGGITTANIGETGEDIFNRLTVRYSAEELRDMFKIIQDICSTVSKTKKDVLGRLYMNLRPNGARGQFFTPDNVSEVMAKIAGSTENDTYSDPCCGSGSLILGVIRTLEQEGKSYQTPIFYLNDVDLFCCKMIFVQMSAIGATAYITCSDALANPPFRSNCDGMWLKTPMYYQRETLAGLFNEQAS